MSQAQPNPEGIGGKIARWGHKLFSGEDENSSEAVDPSVRELGNARMRREVSRRKMLFDEVGAFLFAHDLDLTPLNFGLALDYITGNDIAVETAVRAALHEHGKLTDSVAEAIIARQRVDELTPDSLAEVLAKVEDNLDQLSGLATQSSASAKDFGAQLQQGASELATGPSSSDAVTKLVTLTRSMIERTREVEARMRDGQQQTRLLQKSLESARRAAEHDHLTGLPNRRSFENTLREECGEALTSGEALSVAFCDIDHFKLVNDTHGHDAGDRVLKFVAELLSKISGDKCHVARHGGEEFVMLFRGKTVAEAAQIVDDARADMGKRNLVDSKTGERMEKVTFSGGVADIFAYPDPREALKAADRALYLAKEHGRDRVYIAHEASN